MACGSCGKRKNLTTHSSLPNGDGKYVVRDGDGNTVSEGHDSAVDAAMAATGVSGAVVVYTG